LRRLRVLLDRPVLNVAIGILVVADRLF